MKTTGLKVVNGKYVVPKTAISDWVYDVYVELDEELVAVVGFTERQIKGALFWQIDYDKIQSIWKVMGPSVDNKIKNVAKEYFMTHTG